MYEKIENESDGIIQDGDQCADALCEESEQEIWLGTEREESEREIWLRTEDRLWLGAIMPLLQLHATEGDASERVQNALDRLQAAAAERAIRILRSDMVE